MLAGATSAAEEEAVSSLQQLLLELDTPKALHKQQDRVEGEEEDEEEDLDALVAKYLTPHDDEEGGSSRGTVTTSHTPMPWHTEPALQDDEEERGHVIGMKADTGWGMPGWYWVGLPTPYYAAPHGRGTAHRPIDPLGVVPAMAHVQVRETMHGSGGREAWWKVEVQTGPYARVLGYCLASDASHASWRRLS